MSTRFNRENDIADRRAWMALLASSNPRMLSSFFDTLRVDDVKFTYLRPPEVGLIMIRARMGGTGDRFNVGEATVTRCSVRTSNGLLGHAYVLGRDTSHAELAAKADALLQSEEYRDRVREQLITPLASERASSAAARAAKIASTKVDFITLRQDDSR